MKTYSEFANHVPRLLPRLGEAFVPVTSPLRTTTRRHASVSSDTTSSDSSSSDESEPEERDGDGEGEGDDGSESTFRMCLDDINMDEWEMATPRPRYTHNTPYASPSNPFSYSRQPIFSPGRYQRTPRTPPSRSGSRPRFRTPSSTLAYVYARFIESALEPLGLGPEEMYDTVLQVCFWAAMVIFFGALCGYGYQQPKISLAEVGDMARPGWYGTTWDIGLIIDGKRRLEGIWEGERSVRLATATASH